MSGQQRNDVYVVAFQYSAPPPFFLICFRLVARATSRYQSALKQGAHPGDAWNAASVDFVTAAKVVLFAVPQ